MSLSVMELRLGQFRSHAQAVIAADPQPVVLFGANGAGKTNILEALSLLSPGRGLRRAAAGDMARAPERIGWKIRAMVDTPGGPHEIETRAAADASRTVLLDGKPVAQTALGRVLRVLWMVPAMDRLWTEAASERRRFLDRITLSLEPAHADVSLAYEKAMRERNRLLKDQVADPRWYAGIEAQMAKAGAEIHANRRSALTRLAAASAADSAFPRADLSLEPPADAPAPRAEDDLAEALAEGRRRDLAAGRTLVGPHRDDLQAVWAAKGIAAALASTGEQKALLVSLILANARALSAEIGAAPLLLLDEVAAHLDPDRRAALYDEICALGAQAWLTGTEASLFTDLGPRARWVEVTESAGTSQVHPRDPL